MIPPAFAVAEDYLTAPRISRTRVESNPWRQDKIRGASSLRVLRREDIDAKGGQNLAEVLKGELGFNVDSNGGPQHLANYSLRGGRAGQVLVLVDGRELNDPSAPDKQADLTLINTSSIEKIEILRGSQSGAYGAKALSGVIKVTTRRGARDQLGLGSSVGLTLGSFGRRDLRAGVVQRGEKGEWSFEY